MWQMHGIYQYNSWDTSGDGRVGHERNKRTRLQINLISERSGRTPVKNRILAIAAQAAQHLAKSQMASSDGSEC